MTLKYEVKIVYPSFKGARGDPKSNRKRRFGWFEGWRGVSLFAALSELRPASSSSSVAVFQASAILV
jgi:hypothetical protein